MTTIVAVQNSKGFVFAADAQVTEGDRAYMHPKMTKITEVGEYVMAGAGTSRCCDVVLFGWEPPIYDGTEHYKFMVSKFIPELRKEDEEFCFLVGFDKRVFYIGQDYSVLATSTNTYGIGSGAAYALGALEYGASIEEAINIAKKFDINTGGKIQIIERGYHG